MGYAILGFLLGVTLTLAVGFAIIFVYSIHRYRKSRNENEEQRIDIFSKE